MGYMTVVSILNDGWHTIEEHPQEFVENIFNGMTEGRGPFEKQKRVKSYPVGNRAKRGIFRPLRRRPERRTG